VHVHEVRPSDPPALIVAHAAISGLREIMMSRQPGLLNATIGYYEHLH
jgi:hypothetical protein